MDRMELLENDLLSSGVKVRWKHPGSKNGVYVAGSDGRAFIFAAPSLSPRKRISVLAHEAGHHYSTVNDHPDRNEEAANRWATMRMLKISDLIHAVKNGCCSYYQLAEYMGLEESFVKMAVEVYVKIYGHKVDYENYLVHLLPIWVEDKRTGQFWPEY